jgi:cytochrome c oxidase subunit 4
MTHTHDKSSALRQGVLIFVYLAVLTVLEYFVAVTFNAVSILAVVAVIKAALVMYYYMHIYKLSEGQATNILRIKRNQPSRPMVLPAF